jgi:hypothetical protein
MLIGDLDEFLQDNYVNDVTYRDIAGAHQHGYAVQALDPRRIQLNLQFKF